MHFKPIRNARFSIKWNRCSFIVLSTPTMRIERYHTILFYEFIYSSQEVPHSIVHEMNKISFIGIETRVKLRTKTKVKVKAH